MNGLSDSLTVALVLTLLFGALAFYLYTRIGQIEKRVSLTENILLDLKMATENTLMAMSTPSYAHVHAVEQVSASSSLDHGDIHPSEPIEKDEVEEVNEEDFYKNVLEQAANSTSSDAPVQHESVQGVKVDANYEAMTLKELKDEAKRRGVKVGANSHKKDVIDALKRQGQTSVLEPVPGSMGEVVLDEGFPVELAK
jgi:hypothetical protein